MKPNVAKSIAFVVAGFVAGVGASNLPHAAAADATVPATDLTRKHFLVSIDEVKRNFVFSDEFVGRYRKTVTLSDGTTRQIELVPTVHDGMQVVEFKDTGGHTYMGLNGTTTNGKLMVQVRDVDTMRTLLAQEGWRIGR